MIKWRATDKWGWELTKCGQRDLNNILEEAVDFEMKYKITLYRPDVLYIVIVWFVKLIIFKSYADILFIILYIYKNY